MSPDAYIRQESDTFPQKKGQKISDHRDAMLRVIRACASLLLLEDEHSQGWRPVVARAFRVGSIREAYPFPVLLLCCFLCFNV